MLPTSHLDGREINERVLFYLTTPLHCVHGEEPEVGVGWVRLILNAIPEVSVRTNAFSIVNGTAQGRRKFFYVRKTYLPVIFRYWVN